MPPTPAATSSTARSWKSWSSGCRWPTSASRASERRASWKPLARGIDGLATDQRLISAITLSEPQAMIAKAEAPEAKRILGWRALLNLQLLDFDELAAVHAGRIRAHLEPRSIKIGPMNTSLAAHALGIGATVLNGNLPELARVPGLAAENRSH